ncbi:ABC transporter permease [Photobacterium satsumensis]|uniref:ABC transporter permease n=1 Tax=Photobacterium satsumensis TaxID=2910239 RepID=UPI003D0E7820
MRNKAHSLATGGRFLLLVIMVLAMTFSLLAVSPIDPVLYYTSENLFAMSTEHTAQFSAQLGLDQSLTARFGSWFWHLLQGDLGYSISQQQPVAEILQQRVPLTLRLMIMGWIGSLTLGYCSGIFAAFFRGRPIDRFIRGVCWVSAAAPAFWIALLALSLFGVYLQWTPVCCGAPIGVSPDSISWIEQMPYLVLPTIVLSLTGMGHIAMHTREKAVQVLASEHVLYARMHGKKGWVIYRQHLLRNTLTPAIVLQCAGLSELLGGSALIETVFNFPGIGMTMVVAGLNGDIALLMAVTMLSMLLVFTGNGIARLVSVKLLPEGRAHV